MVQKTPICQPKPNGIRFAQSKSLNKSEHLTEITKHKNINSYAKR